MHKVIVTECWKGYLDLFAPEYRDIYFEEGYVKLYENESSRAESFIYQQNDKVFLFPYLKRHAKMAESGYYDFENAYGYGGPISNTYDASFIESAVTEFMAYAKNSKFIAGFIRFHPLLNNHLLMAGKADVIFNRKTVAMNLEGSDSDIFAKIHSKHRNSIKKAQKLGLRYSVDAELEHLDTFKSFYTTTMRRLKTDEFYYFDGAYFNNLKILRENIFLGLVWFENKIIAGAIFLKDGIYGHYHLSGSLDAYNYTNPNNFLIYETAMFFKKNGIKLFHLGGGSDEATDNPLFKFKKRFSKNEFSFYITKVILDNVVYKDMCSIWEKKFPEKVEKCRNILLKYKY